MKKTNSSALLGYSFLMISMFSEAAMYVLIEFGMDDFPPIAYGVYYLLLPCAFVTLFYLLRYRVTGLIDTFLEHKVGILKVSALSVVSTLIFFYTIAFVGGTSMSLLSKLTIVFSAFLGIGLLKEKVTLFEVVGIIFTFIGAIVLSFENFNFALMTVVLGVLFAVAWSFMSYFLRKELAEAPMQLVIFYRTWIMVFGMIVFMFLMEDFYLPSWQQALQAFVAGMFGIFGAAAFYFQAHKYLKITSLNSLGAITPVLVGMAAYLVFGQVPDFYKLTGGAILIVGALLIVLSKPKENFDSQKMGIE